MLVQDCTQDFNHFKLVTNTGQVPNLTPAVQVGKQARQTEKHVRTIVQTAENGNGTSGRNEEAAGERVGIETICGCVQ